MNLPPVSKIAVGKTMGAAIARQTGTLYVFTTSRSVGDLEARHTPHLIDLADKTAMHRMKSPYDPEEASINHDTHSGSRSSKIKFVDVAVGEDHVVALAADGRLFAAGRAVQGQLGIGKQLFALDDEEPESYEWNYEARQYSENWQQIQALSVSSQQRPNRQVVKIAAGYESTLFVVGDRTL
ncbi:hypothetical protein MBLNU459_g7908t1 [Dothideomycetes sp. NU459]